MPRPKLKNRKVSKSITLNDQTLKLLTVLGDGNLSAGIEIAFQGYLGFRAIQGMGPIPTPDNEKKKKKD